MLKSCQYCGKIHDSKYICKEKPNRKKEVTEADKFRWTRLWQKKREESVPTTKAVTTTNKTAQNKFISVSKAKAIALAHAGVSEKNVSFKKVKLEKDDGIYEYEVEFYVGNWEYEYSINAKTGKILDFEKELDD